MKTILVSDIINQYSLLPPSSIPDHSVLSAKFATSSFEIEKIYENFNVNGNNMTISNVKGSTYWTLEVLKLHNSPLDIQCKTNFSNF